MRGFQSAFRRKGRIKYPRNSLSFAGAAQHGRHLKHPDGGNRATADFVVSSPLMEGEYDRLGPDSEEYHHRKIDRVSPPEADAPAA